MTEKLTRNPVLVLAVAVVFLGVSVFIAAKVNGPTPSEVRSEVQTEQAHLREGQEEQRIQSVWDCQYVGNPIRKILQAEIREEIHELHHIKANFFPAIPKRILHHLLQAKIDRKRRRLKVVAPINCEGIFPP